jgi:hypothetical protein
MMNISDTLFRFLSLLLGPHDGALNLVYFAINLYQHAIAIPRYLISS